jgi:hypothetical protein
MLPPRRLQDNIKMDTSFEVFVAVIVQIVVFWVLTPCGIVHEHRRFGGTSCQHLQDLRIEELIRLYRQVLWKVVAQTQGWV